jgi:hypothetical protein
MAIRTMLNSDDVSGLFLVEREGFGGSIIMIEVIDVSETYYDFVR